MVILNNKVFKFLRTNLLPNYHEAHEMALDRFGKSCISRYQLEFASSSKCRVEAKEYWLVVWTLRDSVQTYWWIPESTIDSPSGASGHIPKAQQAHAHIVGHPDANSYT
jgi:hypothetical protein